MCIEREMSIRIKIRRYFKQNPNASLYQLIKNSDVDLRELDCYIKYHGLQIDKYQEGLLYCSNCGKIIVEGKFCTTCRAELLIILGELLSQLRNQ